MKTYYFIRHGASESNVGNIHLKEFHDEMYKGTDWPLAVEGKLQAAQVGKKLRKLGVNIILSSTLSRTVQTAEIAAAESDLPYGGGWEDLNEIVMGRISMVRGSGAEQGSHSRLRKKLKRPLWPVLYKGMTIAYLVLWRMGKTEGGETREQVDERIRSVLHKLEMLPQEKIAVVGHGYWILFLSRFVLRSAGVRLPLIPGRGWVENGSFTKICQSGERTELKYFSVPFHRVTR